MTKGKEYRKILATVDSIYLKQAIVMGSWHDKGIRFSSTTARAELKRRESK